MITFIRNLFSRKNRVFTIITLIILCILSSLLFVFSRYQETQAKIKNPQQFLKDEALNIAKKVDRHIELPQNEIPSMTTVIDTQKLKGQPFFSKAKNGDKVLIYTIAKRAYLYRPSEDKLIEVSAFGGTTTGTK